MKTSVAIVLLAIALSGSAALSAETKSAQKSDQEQSENIEARLKDARQRLEQAAREVAELSSQLTGPVVDQLMIMGQPPPRAMIGVQLDPESGKDGARVVEVSPGGAAAEAGVKSGDIIVSVDGEKIAGENTARQVTKRMRDVEPQSKVKLRVLRDGKPREIEVTARAAKPFVFGHAMGLPALPVPPPGLDMGPLKKRFLFRLDDEVAGMELATLTPSLGKYFGTEKGVLVVRAPDRDSFKLEDGDVILAIGGREPTSGSHATRILRSYQPGEKIDLKLMRQHKQMNLVVTMPPSADENIQFQDKWEKPLGGGEVIFDGPGLERGLIIRTDSGET